MTRYLSDPEETPMAARLRHARAILADVDDLAEDLLDQMEADDAPDLHARLEELRPRIAPHLGLACRVCGCTELDACDPPCGWAEPGLCTECAWEAS